MKELLPALSFKEYCILQETLHHFRRSFNKIVFANEELNASKEDLDKLQKKFDSIHWVEFLYDFL